MRRALCLVALGAGAAHAQEFRYAPPGDLVPGSGRGRADERVYVPDMRFPIEAAPAFANSQVWGRGGSRGGGGRQCDAVNYSYPWRDDYCESREWEMPLCPSGTGHQGQDIRPSTCEDRRWWAVAADAGTITSIGTYSVTLVTADGTRHRYLHMDPASVAVREGQRVQRGARLGLISDAFGDSSTTIHLHYDLVQNVEGFGNVYVPPYMSLVRSYEALLGQPAVPCEVLPGDGGVLDDAGACFEKYGPPNTWRRADGVGEGAGLWWTYAWVHDTPGNWARWRVHLAEAGRYRVSVRIVPEFAGSEEAPYAVRHDGGEQSLRVDLSGPGPWAAVGEFDFAAGGDQWVAVYDNSGEDRALERRIPADAVRLERLRPAPLPDAGVEADAGPVLEPDAATAPDATPAPEPDAAPTPGPDAAPAPHGDPDASAPAPEPDGGPGGVPIETHRAKHDGGCRQLPGGGLLGLLALLPFARRRRR